MNTSFFSSTRALFLFTALGVAACTSSEEPANPTTFPVTTGDSGAVAGSGSTVPSAPATDGGVSTPAPGVDASAPAPTLDAGSAPSSGSLDTAWCKAKSAFERNCVVCHDGKGTAGTPDKIAFNDLASLKSASPLGGKYFERAGVRIRSTDKPMPPGRNASEADLKILEAWIATGGDPGANPTCTPPSGGDAGAPTADAGSTDGGYVTEWPADCEKRYKIVAHAPEGVDKPYIVPAGQEIHPQVVWDAPWGNDDVQALAFKPITDNKKVLHHWILYAQNGGAFITGWAPGAEGGGKLPDDVGMYIAKGPQSMRLDMHYFNRQGTQPEPDQSGVEVCVVSKAKFRKNTATVFSGFMSIGNFGVLVPANSTNYPSTGVCNVQATQPVTLLTASPHAHTLAHAMKFTATVKGKEVVMRDGPFAFEEQRAYPLDPPVVLNTGDKVTTTCIFTNNTSQDVTFGENTGNEMCFNFALYYPMGALSCSLF